MNDARNEKRWEHMQRNLKQAFAEPAWQSKDMHPAVCRSQIPAKLDRILAL